MIGTDICNITSLSRNQLICHLPATQPPASGPDPSEIPVVIVVVGQKLSFVIGKLSYERTTKNYVIIGVIIGCLILVLVLIGVFVIYHRTTIKKTKDESVYFEKVSREFNFKFKI